MDSLTLDALRQKCTGDIIEPGDSEYEQASTVLVAKGTPALVVRPRNAADAALAIRYATDNDLGIAVRSGGHSGAGFGTNNGGLVIDLIHMNTIEVLDEPSRRLRLGAGATWGEVAKALGQHHLAISSGDTRTVGIGGLTLGAGIGWMVRKYGLAIDSLVAAQVVTADGRVLHVSEAEHPDLFWAVRGGGGNFGVVTSFEFIAHPVGKVYAGPITYAKDNIAGLLKGWREHMRAAPEELTTMFLIMPQFGDMSPGCTILCCYAGDDKDAAMAAIAPLQQLGPVVQQAIAEKDYADVLEDAHMPSGAKVIVHNVFVEEFSDALIETLSKQEGQIVQIRGLGGAMSRVANDATAFAHRGSEILIVSPVFVAPDASQNDIETALKPWRETAAYGSGAYINFLSEVTPEAVVMAYPQATYDRLAAVKKAYDPHNIFNQNFNVKPAA